MALKVIGAGLGRTGTLSLKLALEHLGFGPCYHMVEIMAHARVRVPQWIDVVRGKPDWNAVFDGFASTVDYPTATYWRELAEFYPDAKVVLSVRDADSWYDSVRETIFSEANISRFDAGPAAEFMNAAVVGAFRNHLDDRQYMVDYFNRWRDNVIASLPPERLLVFEARQGWEPLCAFLGAPVPQEPYPRVNSKSDIKEGVIGPRSDDAAQDEPDPEAMEEGARGYLAAMRALAFG